MDVFVIEGNYPLKGEVYVSGAKNAALPLMCAALLSKEPVKLENVPKLTDIDVLLKVFTTLGITYDWQKEEGSLLLNAANITSFTAPYELVSKMRASILVLGPLLARFGKGVVSLPGGCAIGSRPVDILIDGLEKLGVTIELKEGYIHATAPNGLIGADIHLRKPAVTGTENLMMAATYAQGKTTLYNAAKEPEITDLARMLQKMGVRIEGVGTSTLTIYGQNTQQKTLAGCTHTVMPDRIEAGTFMIAAALKGEGVTIYNAREEDNTALLAYLKQSGVAVEISEKEEVVYIPPAVEGTALDVTTEPFPGFPTDLQAQMMLYLTQCAGKSTITENIYENRFMHVLELNRMAANLTIDGQTVHINGKVSLKGAPVMATDLRASACLVLAALCADGQTVIRRIYHLDRGYDHLEEKLTKLGAHVRRMDEKTFEKEAATQQSIA